MLATILDPDPFPEGLHELQSLQRFLGYLPVMVMTATRIGFFCLGGTGTSALDGIQGGREDPDVDADYIRLDWMVRCRTCQWYRLTIVISTELDLAVVIPCVFSCPFDGTAAGANDAVLCDGRLGSPYDAGLGAR